MFSPDGTMLAYLHKDSLGNYDIVVSRAGWARGAQGQCRGHSNCHLPRLDAGRRLRRGRRHAAASCSAFDAAKQGEPALITDKARFSGTVSGLNGWEDRVASLFRAPLGDEIGDPRVGPGG